MGTQGATIFSYISIHQKERTDEVEKEKEVCEIGSESKSDTKKLSIFVPFEWQMSYEAEIFLSSAQRLVVRVSQTRNILVSIVAYYLHLHLQLWIAIQCTISMFLESLKLFIYSVL